MDCTDLSNVDENLLKELQTAIENNDVKLLEELLNRNIYLKDTGLECKKLRSHQARTFGYTDATVNLAHCAAYLGNVEVFNVLLDNGFDVKTRTPRTKWIALHFAAFGGSTGEEMICS